MKGLVIVIITLITLNLSNGKKLPGGHSALIPCEGTKEKNASNNLSYVWTLGPSASPLSELPKIKDRVSVTENGALLINRFTEDDYGTYTCSIKDGDSTVKDVTVNVDDNHRLSAEICHPAACIAAGRCNSPGTDLSCPDEGEVCCSVVRDEDKHHCRHFLGECMKSCHPQIQILKADDCESGTTCCILV